MQTDDEQVTFKTKLTNCAKFLYDSETKLVLGRSLSGWGFVLVFYMLYYGFLAAVFASLLSIFLFATLPKDRPYLTGPDSILGYKAGMHIFKKVNPKNTLFIQTTISDFASFQDSVDRNKELEKYEVLKSCFAKVKKARGGACVPIAINYIYEWEPVKKNEKEDYGIACKGKDEYDKYLIEELEHYSFDKLDKELGVLPTDSNEIYKKEQGVMTSQPVVGVFIKLKTSDLVNVKCEFINLKNGLEEEEFTFQLLVNGDKTLREDNI